MHSHKIMYLNNEWYLTRKLVGAELYLMANDCILEYVNMLTKRKHSSEAKFYYFRRCRSVGGKLHPPAVDEFHGQRLMRERITRSL